MTSFAELLDAPIVAINLGLKMFAESLESQGVKVIHVDWTLPASGDQEVADLLSKLL